MYVLPKNIGSFTLHRKIGTGTVAESYLATGADGRHAVVRRILPFIAKDPTRLAGIQARVAELSGFRHPALVHVTGTVEEGGETFIVEEYVDGVSLERLITAARNQNTTLPPNLFLHIAVQICNALEALHSRQSSTGAESVLHLGIKPGAVFVGPDGKVAVGSFGLTRSPNTLPHGGVSGPVALKIEYLSPEQTHADQQITPASDLFSLGAVLYELLTLESLFRAESNLQTIHRIRRGEVTTQLLRVKGRMPGLDKILYRALSVNPKHRYQRAFVLREDLRGLMSGYSFASVNDDARAWLAPLFEERARTVDIATAGDRAPQAVPEQAATLVPPPELELELEAPPAPRATVTRTLIGLDDDAEIVGGSETTDIGFFPTGEPARTFPDPTASSAGVESASPLQAPRPSLRPVSMADFDEPDTKVGYAPGMSNPLLPEVATPEDTAAWIARSGAPGRDQDLPLANEAVENTAGYMVQDPENTASYIPAAENTASYIPAAENTASFMPSRESTASQLPADDEGADAALDPEPPAPIAPPTPSAAPGFSRAMPGPGLSRPMPGPKAASIAPVSAPPQPGTELRAGRTAPSSPEPQAPAPAPAYSEPDAFAPPPNSRPPLFAVAIGVGIAAIIVCSGTLYGVSQYAIQARAERVAQAMQEAAPPVVVASDDPAATLTEDIAPVEPALPAPEAAVADAAPVEPVAPLPVAPQPVAEPVAPQPVAQPVARTSPPVAQPVARTSPPVAQPVARTSPPVAQPVARTSQPVAQPVARTTTPARPTVVEPIASDGLVDASLTLTPSVDIEALASDARAGRLGSDDITSLLSVPASDPNYTRAQTLLLSNALKKADSAATERALKALLVLPENGYNPQILAADALYQINKGQYDRALARAQAAERYWSRLPPSQSFATRTQIYEIEAAAWQGKFYNSDGDLTALDNAIRGWEKYREHVATESRTDLQKSADAQIAKLQDIKERVE